MADQTQVTRLLSDLGGDDPRAAAALLPLVYEELRELAEQRMRKEPAGLTLQPTALVHEAYLRLVGSAEANWTSRGHFFGAAAEAMRRILIERARRSGRVKHGGGRRRLDLDRLAIAGEESAPELLALNEALESLEAEDAGRAEVVKLRFFAGLTIEQTADALGISRATATRRWQFARAWLYDAIAKSDVESRQE